MLITQEVISKFSPCKNRFDNFISNYPDFNGELKEFLSLDKITYSDKMWVSFRLMTKTQKVKFAIKCAESVLYRFESKYPNDKRPGECLEYLKTYESFENLTQEQKDKIWEVRRAAADAAAYAADAAAADAYAAAADAAADAYADAYAAAYAADAADAAAAADAYAAAYAAADARKTQEDKNLQFVLEVLC